MIAERCANTINKLLQGAIAMIAVTCQNENTRLGNTRLPAFGDHVLKNIAIPGHGNLQEHPAGATKVHGERGIRKEIQDKESW